MRFGKWQYIVYFLLFSSFFQVPGSAQNLIKNPGFEEYFNCTDWNNNNIMELKQWDALPLEIYFAAYYNCDYKKDYYKPYSGKGVLAIKSDPRDRCYGSSENIDFLMSGTAQKLNEYMKPCKLYRFSGMIKRNEYKLIYSNGIIYPAVDNRCADLAFYFFENEALLNRDQDTCFINIGCVNKIPTFQLPAESIKFGTYTKYIFYHISDLPLSSIAIASACNNYYDKGVCLDDMPEGKTFASKQSVMFMLDDLVLEEVTFPGLGRDTVLCSGQTLLLNAAFPSSTFRWQDGTADSTYLVTEPGTYYVDILPKANGISGCSISDTINISYAEYPQFELGPDTTLCPDDTLFYSLNTPYGLFYNSGDTTASLLIADAGVYSITADNRGCTTKDALAVNVVNNDYCNCNVFFPNAFSPNSDGVNETFGPVITCPLVDYSFTIYDRWGINVFETHTPGNNWDGKFKDKVGTTGLYMVKSAYRFKGSEEFSTFNHTFYLLR